MSDNNEYGDHWDSAAIRKYCLLTSSSDIIRLESCVIYDKDSKTAEIIEDNDLALAVMKKMFEAGVPICRRPL